jgi:hypothetical protein
MKPNRVHRARRALRGATLAEVAIAATIATLITGVSIGVLGTGSRTFEQGTAQSTARAQATAALDAMASRLEECGTTTASVAPADANGGPYLTVQKCVGFAGNAIQWGPPITFCYKTGTKAASSPSNPAPNGPGELVMETAGETSILGSSLAAGGFSATLDGSVVTLRVTVQKHGPGKLPIVYTAERKVHFSN